MTKSRSAAWRIHYFQRPVDEDSERSVPTREFLDSIPDSAAADVIAVLDAVAEAPPPVCSGGGKWESMHGGMAGFYEVRVKGGGANHRLFCVLERKAADLGGPSIVCIGGLSKPPRPSANARDYRRIRRLYEEFREYRTVLS